MPPEPPSQHTETPAIDAVSQHERGPAPSPTRIVTERQRLAAKLESVRKQKSESIEKKLAERASLMNEAAENDRASREAEQLVVYYESSEKEGALCDEDRSGFEAAKGLVGSLENRRRGIDRRIEAISKIPDVATKLQEQALAEEAKRQEKGRRQEQETKGREIERIFLEQLVPQVDAIAEKAGDLGYDLYCLEIKRMYDKKGIIKRRDNAAGPITEAIRKAEFEVYPGNAALSRELLQQREKFVYGGNYFLRELRQAVQQMKQSLGVFAFKDKRALRRILEVIGEQTPALEASEKARIERLAAADQQMQTLVQQYEALGGKAKEYDRELQEVGAQWKLHGSDTVFGSLESDYRLRLHGNKLMSSEPVYDNTVRRFRSSGSPQ